MRYSNPHSQQTSNRRYTPLNTRLLGSAYKCRNYNQTEQTQLIPSNTTQLYLQSSCTFTCMLHYQACKYKTPTQDGSYKTSVTYFVRFLSLQKKNIFLKAKKRSTFHNRFHFQLCICIVAMLCRCFGTYNSDIHIGRRGAELGGPDFWRAVAFFLNCFVQQRRTFLWHEICAKTMANIFILKRPIVCMAFLLRILWATL
jgi:hypothetical protein